MIESQFFEIWVEGELSNCKVWNNGHLYFTLKDHASQLKAFHVPVRLSGTCSSSRKTACKVVARGQVCVYEPRGEYQLLCEHLEPQGARRPAARIRSVEEAPAGRRTASMRAIEAAAAGALPRKIGIVTLS